MLDILLQWQEECQAGRGPKLEELCAACPELIEEVRAAIKHLRSVERWMDVHEAPIDTLGPKPDNDTRPYVGPANSEQVSDLLLPPQGEGEIGRLAHYRILKELGRGGMGMVLLAEDTHLQRGVALKVIRPTEAKHPHVRARFLREARAAAKLNHDNVVTIFHVGEERGILYIAMELLKGLTLEAYLHKHRQLVPGQILRMAREMIEGLKAAHAVGLVHRDIKPANIWLEAPKGRVKLLDFGLARDQEGSDQLTASGAVIGTPKYMSPEQADGKQVDARSDLFSLGVVLYRLCTGREPFTGGSMMAVLKALALDKPTSIRQLNPAIPLELEQLVERMMVKDPQQRIQSAKEVGEALQVIKKSLADPSAMDLPEAIEVTATRTHEHTPKVKSPRQQRKAETAPTEERSTLNWLAPLFGLVVLLAGGYLSYLLLKKDKKPVAEEFGPTTTTAPNDTSAQSKASNAIASIATPDMQTKADWVQLFNGKDLTGWKLPDNPLPKRITEVIKIEKNKKVIGFEGRVNNGFLVPLWKVENGLLVGSKLPTHLYTERDDFVNFQMRVVAKINDKGNSGVYFRSGMNSGGFPSGYEAQINCSASDKMRTGSLFLTSTGGNKSTVVDHALHNFNEFFTLEITCVGDTITVLVNGKKTVDAFKDAQHRYKSGHFALQCHDPDTVATFKSIEIRELPAK
jgi:serine/threonine protein kinase